MLHMQQKRLNATNQHSCCISCSQAVHAALRITVAGGACTHATHCARELAAGGPHRPRAGGWSHTLLYWGKALVVARAGRSARGPWCTRAGGCLLWLLCLWVRAQADWLARPSACWWCSWHTAAGCQSVCMNGHVSMMSLPSCCLHAIQPRPETSLVCYCHPCPAAARPLIMAAVRGPIGRAGGQQGAAGAHCTHCAV